MRGDGATVQRRPKSFASTRWQRDNAEPMLTTPAEQRLNVASPIQLPELLAAAGSGAMILTSGARLAAYLSDAYAQQKIQAGESVWESPDIMTWSGWVADSADDLRLRGLLTPSPCLSGLQERTLWAAVIGDALRDTSELDDVYGTAARAQEARRLSIAWRLGFDRNSAGVNSDNEAWLEWNRTFERRLKASGWSESAGLPDELAGLLKAGDWKPRGPIILTGFDELVPQQRDVLDRIREQGGQVEWCELSGAPETVVRHACSDARQEAIEVANWVRARLEARPDARIGIVAPELENARAPLEAALQEALKPGARSPLTGEDERSFNISLGLPLSEQPIVRCALQLLRVNSPWLDLADIGELLNSPFLKGYEAESQLRARLDVRLREQGEAELSLARIASRAEQYGCPGFARIAAHLGENLRSSGRREPSEWAQFFAECLEALGWAGGRSLSSHEYQAAEAFRELIPLLGTLDQVSGKMRREDAAESLRRMTREQLFQPRSEPSAVQILGVLESVGMRFDHLWILGLHDGVWPPAPKPNPFLPLPLQRSLSLPRSGPQRELDMASAYTRRLLESAPDVVVSWPQMSGDEQLRCSPLIAQLPLSGLEQGPDYSQAWMRSMRQSACLESWVERAGPVAPAGPVTGGSGLLKAQSACAFRAFVEHRLGGREIPALDIGLNAMQRGSLVHDVLEALWKNIGSSDELLQQPEAEQLERIETAVSDVLKELAGKFPRTVTAGFIRVEQKRLCELIQRWIDVEQGRPPFRVLACEMPSQVGLAGLEVTLKVDRIDELEDGRKLVIDYKTGQVKPSQWFGDRPEDPQLPLYSIAVEEPVAGLAFGVLRAESIGFQGVAADADVAPDLKPVDDLKQAPGSWTETREHWVGVLERLAREYRDGHAEVNPNRYPQDCKYCALSRYGVCRVREKLVTAVEEDVDD